MSDAEERTSWAATGQHEGPVLLDSPALENPKRNVTTGKNQGNSTYRSGSGGGE